ncbi:Gfo/Idh/MocA family protein [Halosimplex sp. J119]
MPTHRIAIAGAGNAAGTHARAFEQLEDAEVVACTSRSMASATSFADERGCEAYESVDSMLDDADPDVLDVCTPSGAHLDPTLAAAERGVDVLCEKPLEVTTERVDRMIEAADEHGIRLGGIFQRRYKPVLRTVREAVDEGRFGSLSIASTTLPWWRDDDYYDGAWQADRDASGGGAVMNQAIHNVDALQWIAGAGMDLERGQNPVAEVFAFADVRAHDDDLIEVEDAAVATLRFRDGTLGQVLATTGSYPGGAARYEFGGRDGSAAVTGEELDTWEFRAERDEDAEVRERFSGPDASADEPDPLEVPNVREFLDARERGEPFMLDGPESRKAVAIVEAVYESAERGESVTLE